MNFTGSNKELLLIHKEIKQPIEAETINVMLTPRFYTLKKEILPIKYAYQAKRIAPSLFDGLLEAGRQYDYMVYKEAEFWIFLAYDLEMIMDFLQSKGMALEQVSKLFFAQQAAQHLSKPVLLSDTEALVGLDGIATVIPRSALGDEGASGIIDNAVTPKKGVVIQGAYGSILSLKQAVMFASVCLVFAMMFFVEGLRYGSDGGAEEEMQTLLSSHPSLQSSYARQSVMTKFKALDSTERTKRDTLKQLSEMLFKGVTLLSFKMEGKQFEARFSCKDAEIANRIKALAQKHRFKTSAFTGSNDLKIEGAL